MESEPAATARQWYDSACTAGGGEPALVAGLGLGSGRGSGGPGPRTESAPAATARQKVNLCGLTDGAPEAGLRLQRECKVGRSRQLRGVLTLEMGRVYIRKLGQGRVV